MKMRKILSLVLAIVLMGALFAACTPTTPVEGGGQTMIDTSKPVGEGGGNTVAPVVPAAPADEYTGPFGRLCSKFADTHETYVRNAASALCDAKGWTIDHAECNEDQVVMNDKLTLMYTKGYKAVITGAVNSAAAGTMIDIARTADNAYIIFQKNEPNPIDEFNAYDNAMFCGSIYQQAGQCQGDAVLKFMKANPDKWDKNGDGKLQYVMLMGRLGGMETTFRTEWSIKQLTDNGVVVDCLYQDTAEWNRVTAMEKMQTWLTALPDDSVEAVFANNDDMAAGAIEAMKADGYFGEGGKYAMVVGIDATTVGRDFMREGALLATSYNNPIALGEATVYLAYALTNGIERTSEGAFDGIYSMSDRDRNPDVNGKYVWLDYVYVDMDNIDEFERVYIS